MKEFTSSIGNIIDALRQAKEDPNIGCSLLIGAGCSVSAGIPTGQGFVDIIKDKWPKKRIANAPLTKEEINDSDLDSVRDKAWFKKLVG